MTYELWMKDPDFKIPAECEFLEINGERFKRVRKPLQKPSKKRKTAP